MHKLSANKLKRLANTSIFEVLQFNMKTKEIQVDFGSKKAILKNSAILPQVELEVKKARIKGRLS